LFAEFDYESAERYPSDSPWWSEAYHPNAVSTTHNTDPKIVSKQYKQYCCPKCGCSQLGHLRGEYHKTTDGEYNMYECANCKFRVKKQEITRLTEALENAADTRDINIGELETIDYTPECVKYGGSLISDSLPWDPNTRSTDETNKTLSTYTMTD
jgi:hypothetical protein